MAFTDVMMLSVGVKSKIVDAATATGTARAQRFCVSAGPTSLRQVKLIAGSVITALVADLEASTDEGVTWVKDSLGYDFVALPAQNMNCIAGVIYRLNLTTVTDGPVDVYAFFG